MPYRLTTFNGIRLPDAMTEDDLGAPPAQSTIVDSIGGGFNFLGNNRYYPKRHPIKYAGMYVTRTTYLVDEAGNRIVDEAGNYIVTANAATVLRAQVDDIKAQHGKWANLTRRREDDSIEQYKNARLINVAHLRTLSDTDRIARLSFDFEAEGRPWRSIFATEVVGALTPSVITSHTVVSAGTEEIRDAIITFTASSTINAVALFGSQYTWTWSGTLSAGQSLVIDCGAQTVKKNGADAYSGFALYAGHTGDGWLTLAGSGVVNTLEFFTSGGPGTVSVLYTDQWA